MLPEAHATHPSRLTLLATVGGTATIYRATQLLP